MADSADKPATEVVDTAERGWAYAVGAVVAVVFAVIIYSGLHWAAQPPSNIETIDASQLHLAGEFVEANLGTETRPQPDGSLIVRVIAQQYSFVPSCIVVPVDTPITFRVTSPDVIHGFLISGTNVNSMVVPGFVSEVRAQFDQPGEHLMPCHEYCSVGHAGMWAEVKVLKRSEFNSTYIGKERASCVR